MVKTKFNNIKIEFKGVKIVMPYALFENIMQSEGIEEWIEFNPNSNYIVEKV